MAQGVYPTPETVSALLIIATILHALALILTFFRLCFRYYIRRFWWDDFWAALALCGDAVCVVAVWTLTAPLSDPYFNFEALPTTPLSRSAHIISYWLGFLCYTCTIWSARLSIVFSVIRVVPPARSNTITALSAAAVFACMWAYVFTCKSVACAVDRSWYNAIVIQCPIPNWVAVSEVCTDTISDAILVALPVRLLWRVKLPSNQRTMVLSVFSASVLVSIVSAVHTAYLIPSATFIGGATAEMEGSISLIVCNLLVVVTFIYRMTRSGQDLAADICDKSTTSSNHLTTVDLDVSGFTATTAGATGTATTGSTFTGTRFTGTEVSSVNFASMGSDKETTFGSVIASGGSVLPGMSPSKPAVTSRVMLKK